MDLYWRYGSLNEYVETLIEIIGTSTDLEITNIEYHTNDNSVYVSWSGEDGSGGDGTQENPYRTIQYAKDMMNSNQTIITIMDSNYYYTGDAVDLYLLLDGITLQGMEGMSPSLSVDTLIAAQQKMIDLRNGGKIINVLITAPEEYSEDIVCIEARDGDIQNVTINNATKYAIYKITDGTLDITNSVIKNSINSGETYGSGLHFIEGTVNIDYSLFDNNDYSAIYMSGSAVKYLTIDYCTIADNQYGIHEYNSSNNVITGTNSILYRNNVYDVYGDSGNYSYSCIGKIKGEPTFETVAVRTDPLFVSSNDYRVRTKYNGFVGSLISSSCIATSSDGLDMGCYQYTRVSATGSIYEFTTSMPLGISYGKRPVDAELILVNSLTPVLLSKGNVNYIDLQWQGNDNVLTLEEYTYLSVMFDFEGSVYLSSDEGVVYVEYKIDKTKGFNPARCLPTQDNTLFRDVSLTLLEV